jgi:L-alanine-DL-glutamate epimerase-like enolase superfamily enzyme
MRITGGTVMAVGVNFEGVMPATHVVLRLATDAGIEGIAYLSRVTTTTMKPLVMLLENLVEALVGEPAEIEPIHNRLFRPVLGAPVCGMHLRAASAIDVALWDIKGKALGQPVWRLMGGFRDRLPVSGNWGLMPGPDASALPRQLDLLQSRGFRAVKCPVGLVPLEQAIGHVRAARSHLGPGVRIIVDGNFQWDRKQASRFARETEDLDLYWIEDPLPYHDFTGMTALRRATRQPICAGEVFQHPHEFAWLMAEQCSDYIMIDQDLGLTGFLKVAHMAQVHNLPVVNHLAPETLAHALAGVPNGLIVGLVPWGQPLFREQALIVEGNLVLSDQPGLGLTLNEEVLAACRLA